MTARASKYISTGRPAPTSGSDEMLNDDFVKAEWTAVPLALGILLVAFGALVAALLPVALAVTAFIAANGLLTLASYQLHIFDTTSSVMLLMGLAVGVDYCLFYLRRERDERAAGRDADTALRVAAATSGRAVLVSGLTVMVAMSGMFLSGLLLFKGFAMATILVVLIAMLGSVTILPALLSWLGDRVERGRLPFTGNRQAEERSSRITRASRPDSRPSAVRADGFRPPCCVPYWPPPECSPYWRRWPCWPSPRPRSESRPNSSLSTSRCRPGRRCGSARRRSARPSPAVPSPPASWSRPPTSTHRQVRDALADFKEQAGTSRHFGKDIDTTLHRKAGIAEISVPLAGNGSDATSEAAVKELRGELIPRTLEPVAKDGQAYVDGETAGSMDFNGQLRRGIVPVFAFITAVTFLLMLVCFRSVPIALASVVLNLLSVGAAYGVMTAVFQHGWGAELLGTEAVGAIESWMPLFVLVVLFGLSMDYHVFVVSRIREAHERGVHTREAIREGVRATAGAVTGAAVIMVAVFAVFGTLSMQDMQQMGIGLAAAVLLDATLVRMVLLPAVMTLLGERNWYLPRWLRWLPDPERTDPARTVAASPADELQGSAAVRTGRRAVTAVRTVRTYRQSVRPDRQALTRQLTRRERTTRPAPAAHQPRRAGRVAAYARPRKPIDSRRSATQARFTSGPWATGAQARRAHA